MENLRFYFNKPLIKATIESRINRFIFIVNLNGTKVEGHCPVGGTIAGIPRKEFKNIPCLMSDNSDNPIYKDFIEDLKIAKACGVKQFQMNIKITDEYAELLSIIENEVI